MSDQHTLIAIVDDEEPVRRALGRLLESAGMTVEKYSSGRDFLVAAKHSRPACVLLDLHMPDMSGFEVLAALQEEKAEIPVVVITGYHSRDAKARVQAQGAATLLQKPINDRLLLSAIEDAIQPPEEPNFEAKS